METEHWTKHFYARNYLIYAKLKALLYSRANKGYVLVVPPSQIKGSPSVQNVLKSKCYYFFYQFYKFMLCYGISVFLEHPLSTELTETM